jgi:DNA recombination protein RmuC
MDIVLFCLFSLLLGIGLGYIIGKLQFSRLNIISEEEWEEFKKQKLELEVKSNQFQNLYKQYESELKLEKERIIGLVRDKAELDTINKTLLEKQNKQETELKDLNKKFQEEFSNISNRLLIENTKHFNEESSKTLETLLSPFKENLNKFEKKVEESRSEYLKDSAGLKEQIHLLHNLNQKISEEAKNLTEALKGNSKTRGNWGESILEKILERSGLIEGRDYFLQQTLRNEERQRHIPDVIIQLPGDKNLIIDSKVSLIAYDKYISTENEIEKDKFLVEHIESLRRHIKELSEKNYFDLTDKPSPDFVFMFIPIETSLEIVYKSRPEFYNEAFEKNIILITPTTLIATLRMVSLIWKQEKQNKNVQQITGEAIKMIEKIDSFLTSMLEIETNLDKAKLSYIEAWKKLSAGRGSVKSIAEKVQKLGAKSPKKLHNLDDSKLEDDSEE